MQTAIPCTLMRGGTSKGAYFLARDLSADPDLRDRVLLAVMGSPDLRQIDGLGGAHPLTSKVAIVGLSTRADADVDYLFAQVVVDEPRVDLAQNCGNILAGVGPFAIEQGLVPITGDLTPVRIHMVNSGDVAVARVRTAGGSVRYDGDARIDGVPGTAAPVVLDFLDVAGSVCGALLPTGNAKDVVAGVEVTLIDNGMPVVVLRAEDLGVTGTEIPKELEANAALKERVEKVRLAAGPLMNLGDVTRKTTPKMSLVSLPRAGGAISTRTFIPHRVHEAIGVLGAVSVATACLLPGSVAQPLVRLAEGLAEAGGVRRVEVEHPTGSFLVEIELDLGAGEVRAKRSALLRTARKIFAGNVFIPSSVWDGGGGGAAG
jgi:4-oxalomesaconate tautomerase